MNEFLEMTEPRFCDPTLHARFAVPQFLAPLVERIDGVCGMYVSYPYPENWRGGRWEFPVYVPLDEQGAAGLTALLLSERRFSDMWGGYGSVKISLGSTHILDGDRPVLYAQLTVSGSHAGEVAAFLDYLVLPGDPPSDEVSDEC